jgi:hypothetical protein
MKRLRGEHVAAATALLLAAVAAVTLRAPAEATITVPGLAGRALSVVGTGRRIEPDRDTFVERFPALGARVYQTVG